jgi:hypothetical protein
MKLKILYENCTCAFNSPEETEDDSSVEFNDWAGTLGGAARKAAGALGTATGLKQGGWARRAASDMGQAFTDRFIRGRCRCCGQKRNFLPGTPKQ